MQNLGYPFPYVQGSDSIASAFGIKVYPTLVAVRNDTLLLRGTSYEVLSTFLKKLPFE